MGLENKIQKISTTNLKELCDIVTATFTTNIIGWSEVNFLPGCIGEAEPKEALLVFSN